MRSSERAVVEEQTDDKPNQTFFVRNTRTDRPQTRSNSKMREARLEKELRTLTADPGPGITAWKGSTWNEFNAQMTGPENSPYSEGIFSLHISVPDRFVSSFLTSWVFNLFL